MDVILLERVARLGDVGDVVKVKNGYGRNFLVPAAKAVRATEANKKEFELKRASLEARNKEMRETAQKQGEKLGKLSVKVVRQASEGGNLFGSVSARDVAMALVEQGHTEIERRMIDLTETIKSLGLYTATITLHPEVKLECKIEVVRNLESSAYDEMAAEEENDSAAAEPEAADEEDAA